MATSPPHRLYFGRVMHHRLKPFDHKFEYRVFSCLFDLDRLAELDRGSRIFSYNKKGLFSFFDRDHGPKDGSALQPWAQDLLRQAGIETAVSKIYLLCYPRIFGYVFNPLSVYYCYGADGELAALIYEVSNTFGERYCYVGEVRQKRSGGGFASQQAKKEFYVSPFFEVAGNYHFGFIDPVEQLGLTIRLKDRQGVQLLTSLTGARAELNGRNLFKAFFAYPLMTVKVIVAIHWEALRLWRKGAKLAQKPSAVKAGFGHAASETALPRAPQIVPLKLAS